MNLQELTKKMHRQLLKKEVNWSDEPGLIDTIREVNNIEEYYYFHSTCKRNLEPTTSLDAFWIEGYVLGLTPIRSKENFYVLEVTLENGHFLKYVISLDKELSYNFEKLVAVMGIEYFAEIEPNILLCKPFNLLVTTNVEGNEPVYYLHDVCEVRRDRTY